MQLHIRIHPKWTYHYEHGTTTLNWKAEPDNHRQQYTCSQRIYFLPASMQAKVSQTRIRILLSFLSGKEAQWWRKGGWVRVRVQNELLFCEPPWTKHKKHWLSPVKNTHTIKIRKISPVNQMYVFCHTVHCQSTENASTCSTRTRTGWSTCRSSRAWCPNSERSPNPQTSRRCSTALTPTVRVRTQAVHAQQLSQICEILCIPAKNFAETQFSARTTLSPFLENVNLGQLHSEKSNPK